MKLIVLAVVLWTTWGGVLAAGEVPAVKIGEVAKISEDWLKERGLSDRVFVRSIELRRASGLLVGNREVWVARWSKTVPASDPKMRETGLEVTLEGKVSRLVENGTPEITR